jgi:hypothetical protein
MIELTEIPLIGDQDSQDSTTPATKSERFDFMWSTDTTGNLRKGV